MTCGKCGKNNADNLKFCTGCGGALSVQQSRQPQSQQPRICSYCGSDIEAGSPYCGICGRQAGQARQSQQASEPVLDMRRPAEPRNQSARQPRSRQSYDSQSYDETPQRRAYSEPERQFRRQPQNAPTRQGQRERREAGFAGLPISRNAFFGIVSGVVAVVLIIVIVTASGGGLSGTYMCEVGDFAIRFSGRNFTIYYHEWGTNEFYEVEGGTFILEGGRIQLDFDHGGIERGNYDSSRGELSLDGGDRLRRLQSFEERDLEFVSRGRISGGGGRNEPPSPADPAPPPTPEISQPPDSTSPLEGEWLLQYVEVDHAIYFFGNEFYITFYSIRVIFDEELREEFYGRASSSDGLIQVPPRPPIEVSSIFGRSRADFPRTLIETVVDEELPYISRELYKHEIMGVFGISSTAQGDVIELVWEDGQISVFDLLVTQNTITVSSNERDFFFSLTELIRRN